ncbi:MAG TPA: chemotaxis protein CheB [Longimicrobiaceae bacterium]|jgi:two-component system chemotaxis response regulator CheB
MTNRDIIVVGASAGGIEALRALLGGLPGDLRASVFVVMHVAPDSPGILPRMLQDASPLPVEHARDGEPIEHGRVYVAPPDCHLLLERDRVRLSRGPKENLSRPAIDPLFRSAAHVFGARVVGVVLTGRLDDGTAGLWAVKRRGGAAVVQDPDDATYPSMPRSAIRYVEVDEVGPAAALGPVLARLAGERPPPDPDPGPMRELEIETRIARDDNALAAGVMDLGPFTPFTCPECHGVLVSLKEGGVPRFRCHTGHAYSLDSLLSAVGESLEDTLWTALRAVEEGILLLDHVAAHVRGTGEDHAAAEAFERQAREADGIAAKVREAVMRHRTVSRGALAREEDVAD